MNLLTNRELELYLSKQKNMKFLRLFHGAWENSAYEFAPQQVDKSLFSMKPVHLTSVLKTGIMNIAEIDDLLKTFRRNKKLDVPISLTDQFDSIVRQFNLETRVRELAEWMNGKSINRIKNQVVEEFEDCLRIGFLLIVSTGAEFVTTRVAAKGKTASTPKAPKLKKAASKSPVQKRPEETDFTGWNVDKYQNAIAGARTHFDKENFSEAESLIEEALALNPDSTEAMAMLAWSKFQLQGKTNLTAAYESKELLKKAISLDDSNDLAYLILGKIFKHEGKETLAHSHFLKAHSINPANEEAQREVKLMKIKRRKENQFRYRH
jgi:tetratricopeptide (TPR) repeat protein